MITLFTASSAGAKTYLLCNLSTFLFSTFAERLGGCLYKWGCVVKFSILMSTMRINSFFQYLRACTTTPSFLHPRFAICLKRFLDNTPAFSKINPGWKSVLRPLLKKWSWPPLPLADTSKVACDNIAWRWIQKWWVRTRARRLNRTPNIRIRSNLFVVENDISNSFCTFSNKRSVKNLEILWDLRGDSVISKNVEKLSKSRPWLMTLI